MSTQPTPKTTETPKTATVATTSAMPSAAQTKKGVSTAPVARQASLAAKPATTTDQPATVSPKTAKPKTVKPQQAGAHPDRSGANQPAGAEPARRSTKKQIVIDQLGTPAGVTIADLQTLTGWQPHTIRATLSMLRKAGMAVTSERVEDGPTRYRIIAAPLDKTTDVASASQPSGAPT